jgi:superfamily II DNA or RNA helicase
MIKLRPYQKEAIQAVLSAWNENEQPNALVVAATGSGKTEIGLAILVEDGARRALWIAHRQELIYQPRERALAHWPQLGRPGVVMANQNECRADFIIATIQTLNTPGRLEEILESGPITHIVTDECFVAGTLIDGRPIESFEIGESITAFDCTRYETVQEKVLRISKRPAPDILYCLTINGKEIVCTPEHPFLVGKNTWKEARVLQKGDCVVQCTMSQLPNKKGVQCVENANVSVPLVQKDFSKRPQMETRSISDQGTGVLQSRVQQSVLLKKVIGNDGSNQSQVCVRKNEAQQSHAQSPNAQKDADNLESNGLATTRSGRQWSTFAGCSTIACLRIGLGNRISGHVGRKACKSRTSSNLLQDRYSRTYTKNWDRGRRGLSLLSRAQSTRQKKGDRVTRARVDHIEILKRGRTNGFEEVCPDGFVYNLEVSNQHNYLVNGLVVHNCHHSTASSYLSVYERINAWCLEHSVDSPVHLGLTATPKRTDGEGLRKVFDVVAYKIGIKQLVKSGHLCPFSTWGITLPVSFDTVKENANGWSDDAAGDILACRNVEDMVLTTWEKHAQDRPTIAFTASVLQAYALAQRFQETGYAFEALDGTTKKAVRKDILARFKRGELQGVINCAVLTEGFDAPHAACLLQVRPTKSDLVYVQMAGRVLRTSPGKDDALILDFCPADARDMVMGGDLLGKPRQQRKAEERAEAQGIVGACGINRDGDGIDGDPDEIVMKMLDYMSTSSLSWYVDGDLASVSVSKKQSLAILLPDETRKAKADALKEAGNWDPKWDNAYERISCFNLVLISDYRGHDLGHFETWEEATSAADDWIEEHGIDGTFAKKSARWRRLEATEKQKRLLGKFGVWETLQRQDRGTAARAITHVFANKALHKKR